MPHLIVESKETETKCWSPVRFVGECYKCNRFKDCRYPEKLVKTEKQKILDQIKDVQEEIENRQRLISELRQKLFEGNFY